MYFVIYSFFNIKDIGVGFVFIFESLKENSGVLVICEFYGSWFFVEMVVLSVCDIGLGVEIVEGNLGLICLFLIGGVLIVVFFLW